MLLFVVAFIVALQAAVVPPATLPPSASAKLRDSLNAAKAHKLDMAKNAPVLDRVVPDKVGGYPVNYGIVPQTVSSDGDPLDVLVLGPAIPTGTLVKGAVVGLMHMRDETGLDSKVVISPVGADGRPTYRLTEADRGRLEDYFNRYKRDDDDPKTFATVPGWGTAAEALVFVRVTHGFFLQALK